MREIRLVSFLAAFSCVGVTAAFSADVAPPPAPATGKSGLIEQIAAVCRAETGDDDAALDRLVHKMDEPMAKAMSLPAVHRSALIEALSDKSNPWCVRYFAGVGLSQSRSPEIVEPLAAVLGDKAAPPRARAGAAIGLQSVVGQSPKAKEALTQVLYEPNVPAPLLAEAMKVLGQVGVNDMDLMLKIMDAPVKSVNGLGTNFNSIRAIAASDDPKSMEVLIRLLDKYPPLSLFRGVVLDELDGIVARNPPKLAAWRKHLVEKLIVTSRGSYRDSNEEAIYVANLNQTAMLMGRLADPAEVDRLVEIMEDRNMPAFVVSHAAEALGKIGDARALPHLQKLRGSLLNHFYVDDRLSLAYDYYQRTGKCDQRLCPIIKAIDKLSKK